MKIIKKFAGLILAMVMAMSLTMNAFAVQGVNDNSGSITINDAVPGQTYRIYQLLVLESYNAETNAYSYKANSDWEEWLRSQTSYVSFDSQGYVAWKEGADAAAFAKAAQAEIGTRQAVDSATAPDADEGQSYSSVTFNNLNLGYYLIDTTLGTLCSLDTTNPAAVMYEKNEVPTNVKTVEEDSSGVYGEKNDADIGDTVNFKSTITAQAGAENYVFHDTMSVGLTFGSVTDITLNGTPVTSEGNYTVTTETGEGENCTFHVVFTQDFCDTLKANDQIVISYTATVNETAVIGGAGNPNESRIEYGETGNTTVTPPSTTKTYTWNVDILKYTLDDTVEIPLAGAVFTLSKNEDGTNPISLVTEKVNVYRVATEAEKNGADTEIIEEITTDGSGAFTIKGLDADTYYLTELEAPDGYNKLAGPVKIIIGENGSTSVESTETDEYGNPILTEANPVKVQNNSGTELPETGGMGTTILYIAGAALVLFAVLLLFLKKRSDKKV